MKPGDIQIRQIAAALDRLVGEDNYSQPSVGDLSMLFDGCERVRGILSRLMEGYDANLKAKILIELQHEADFIGDICSDLADPLEAMVNEAYSDEK